MGSSRQADASILTLAAIHNSTTNLQKSKDTVLVPPSSSSSLTRSLRFSKSTWLSIYLVAAKPVGRSSQGILCLCTSLLPTSFLAYSSARCLIDLCAAPGGWLQVATKYMPPNSIILGVDLVPIKPIPRVITAAEDITTERCRKWLREQMKDWKADVVLHDGAPNVGTAWAQDAFTQSELVLSSMKLAVEFLNKGGTFVTKVFRSKDYNSLLWVFNQLFTKVEATKPPSSRNVSAEIFVVCSGFLAPKKIDPKLLNPTHVFKDLDVVDAIAAQAENADNINKDAGSTSMHKLTPAAFSVFHPDKKRRAREGYDEGDYTLHKKVPVLDFIKTSDPISVLGTANQLDFGRSDEEQKVLKSEVTTEDVRSSCQDLKVLGKRDFKNLLKWRSAIREELDMDLKAKAKPASDFTENAEVSAMPVLDEEEQMALDIERLETEEAQKRKKAKRRANEKKTREIQRMQLHMTTPMDIGLERQDDYAGEEPDFMFDLNEVEGYGGRRKPVRLQGNEADDSEDETATLSEDEPADEDIPSDEEDARYADLEANLDELYDEYQNTKLEKDAKHKVKEARKKRDAQAGEDGEWAGIGKKAKRAGSDDEEASESEEEDDSEDDEADTLAYFDEDRIPEDELDSSDEDSNPPSDEAVKNSLIKDFKKPKPVLESSAKSRAAAMWFDQPVFKDIQGLDELMNIEEPVLKGKKKAVSFEDEDDAAVSHMRFYSRDAR